MATTTRHSTWPATLGKVGSEYSGIVAPQPKLLIWIRRQSIDEAKRERLINQFRREHAHLEKQTLRSLSGVFDDLTAKILDRFNEAGTVAVQAVELFHQAELAIPFNNAMKPCWLRTAESGIHFEAGWSGVAKPQFYVPKNRQDLPSIELEMSAGLQKSVNGWLKNRTEGVWGLVAKTIHNRLETTLKRGLKDGLTLDQMTAEIETTLKGIKEYQAKRIARTETTGGMNFGGHAERIELGIQHKEWVSTIDARTRGMGRKDRYDHISSNGEIVMNSVPFIVSGQKLLYPADASLGASAGNICNCRCCSVGAWPKSPLKKTNPAAPEEPTKRPKGWIEPKYDKAERLTTPLPKVAPTPAGSKQNQQNIEARKQSTTDNINEFRDQMAKHNDTLEAIRQKCITGQSLTLENRYNELLAKMQEQTRNGFPGGAKYYENLVAEIGQTIRDMEPVRKAIKDQFLSSLGIQEQSSIAIRCDRDLDEVTANRALKVAKWYKKALSAKNGKEFEYAVHRIPGADNRAYAVKNNLFMSPASTEDVHAHEVGHVLEDRHKKLGDLAKGFMYHRTGSESSSPINEKNAEVGVKDDWAKSFGLTEGHYVGKYYNGATEVIAMGVQLIYENPTKLAALDPEYFKFICGVLRGDFL